MTTNKITIPDRLEREFAAFRMRIDSDVHGVMNTALVGAQLRQDDHENPDLLAMIALLGIGAASILNEAKLRARLTRIARTLSREKQFEFIRLLGKFVDAPSDAALAGWVDVQTAQIQKATRLWLERSAETVATQGIQPARIEIAATVPAVQKSSAVAASAAILALTGAVVSQVAQANGLTHYKWETAGDDLVRDWHAELDGTIQAWASPPPGGGTDEGEAGHPLSGYGCRCTAQPIA